MTSQLSRENEEHQQQETAQDLSVASSSKPWLEWTSLPSMCTKRHGCAGAIVTTSSGEPLGLYVAGGYDGQRIQNTVEFYDVLTRTWYTTTSMPTGGRRSFSVVSLDNQNLVVLGGYDQTQQRLDTVDYWESSSDTWFRLPSMTTTRWHCAAVSITLKSSPRSSKQQQQEAVVVMGGCGGTRWKELNSVEIFFMRTSQAAWQLLPPMQRARTGCAAVVIGSTQIMVTGGYDGHEWLDNAEIYDFNTNQWTFANTRMPMACGFFTATLVENDKNEDDDDKYVVVVGGRNGTRRLDTIQCYSVKRQTWTLLQTRMTTPKEGCVVGTIGRQLVVAGGWTGRDLNTLNPTRSVEQLNFQDSNNHGTNCLEQAPKTKHQQQLSIGSEAFSDPMDWKQLSSLMSLNRHGCAAAVLFGHMLVVMGGSDGLRVLRSTEVYDGNEHEWDDFLPSMRTARCGCAATSLDQYVIVVGGYNNKQGRLDTAEYLDVNAEKWRTLPLPMSTPRWYCAAVGLPRHGVVVVVGGRGRLWETLNTVEAFDFFGNHSWKTLADMSTPRFGCAAVAVCKSNVMVVGGYDGKKWLDTAEIYDFESNTWELLPPMPVPCGFCAAAVQGKYVIVTGGRNEHCRLATTQRFNIESKTWSLLPKMAMAREASASSTVAGQVVVVGGWSGDDTSNLIPVNTAECLCLVERQPLQRAATKDHQLSMELPKPRPLIIQGKVMEGEDLITYCRKRGLCQFCGEVKTHKEVRRRFFLTKMMEPLTTTNDAGEFTVYKGYCIKSSCYTLDQAKRALGEGVSSAGAEDVGLQDTTIPTSGDDASPEIGDAGAQIGIQKSASSGTSTQDEPSIKFPDSCIEKLQNSHSTMEDTLDALNGLLSWIVTDEKDNKTCFAEAGGILAIITSMQRHEEESEVQERACRIIGTLASGSRTNQTAVAEQGGIPVVVRAMQQHLDVVGVQQEACSVLKGLARNHSNSIDAAGGITAIIMTMNRHQSVSVIQEQALVMLGHMTGRTTEKTNAIVEAGGIEAIIASMKWEQDVANIQELACVALTKLAAVEQQNQELIAAQDGITAVLAAMEWHKNVPSVQENACSALANLSVNAGNQVLIAAKGGITAIIVAMEQHMDVPLVQEKGCIALRNLAVNSDNKVMIASAGGIVAVVRAMKLHKMDKGLQEEACWALRNLAVNRDNQTAIAREGGITAIVETMKNHMELPECDGIQEKACFAISNLASGINDNRQMIAGAGGVSAIVAAMKSYPYEASVQLSACGALWNLAVMDEIQSAIIKAGGVITIIDAMQRHKPVAGIQEKACGALRNLLSFNDDDDSVVALLAPGGSIVVATISAMQQHEGSSAIQEHGCALLWILAAKNDENKRNIIGLDGVAIISTAMERHKDDTAVQEQAFGALSILL